MFSNIYCYWARKFRKFHVPKSRQMKSKQFSTFFSINELQKPLWNGFSLAWSKTFDEFAFYLIWYDVGGKAKSCFQNPNFVIYCIIILNLIRLDSWSLKFWGACVYYKDSYPLKTVLTLISGTSLATEESIIWDRTKEKLLGIVKL